VLQELALGYLALVQPGNAIPGHHDQVTLSPPPLARLVGPLAGLGGEADLTLGSGMARGVRLGNTPGESGEPLLPG
jgi:hypothetical protein